MSEDQIRQENRDERSETVSLLIARQQTTIERVDKLYEINATTAVALLQHTNDIADLKVKRSASQFLIPLIVASLTIGIANVGITIAILVAVVQHVLGK